MNKQETLFRIPWTRIGQPNWRIDHSLFVAYRKFRDSKAEEYDDVICDVGVMSRMKSNFRSALHKSRDFIYDASSSQLNLQTGNYRVYRVLRHDHRRVAGNTSRRRKLVENQNCENNLNEPTQVKVAKMKVTQK